jgi:rare lipoprotein A
MHEGKERSFIVPALLPGLLLVVAVVGLLALVWPERGPAAEAYEPDRPRQTQVGKATFYGPGFQGKRTASGARFDQQNMTAAHRTLPFGTRVRVTNLDNGQSVVVVVTDRGPYGRNRSRGAIIDLSKGAAAKLDFIGDGLTRVRLEVLDEPEDGRGDSGVE